MDTHRQKHLVLILAREFASNLSTPTLIADERGYLVFYNEAAEGVVGRRFGEVTASTRTLPACRNDNTDE